MTARKTSRDAYHEIERMGRLGEQQRQIMKFFMDQPRGAGFSRRDLVRLVQLPINVITGRVNELIAKGWLEDESTTVDATTRKTVHLVKVKQYQPQGELALT
jgi:hypothetical protein